MRELADFGTRRTIVEGGVYRAVKSARELGCPEHILRGVEQKNAERRNRLLGKTRTATTNKPVSTTKSAAAIITTSESAEQATRRILADKMADIPFI
jgi:hypothetical protein